MVGKVVVPVAHVVPFELNCVSGPEAPFLPVEGLMAAELLGEQEGAEAGSEDAAGEEAGFKGRGDGDGVGIVFAHVGLALDDFAGEGGRGGVEADADFFAEEAEGIWVG